MCTSSQVSCSQKHELWTQVVKPLTTVYNNELHHYHRPSPYRKPTMPHDGRRSRVRLGKLPKMNNSERGKYYRQKYKQYEDGLEDAAGALTKQIQDLSLLLQLRDTLAAQQSALRHCSGAMVAHISQLMTKRRASAASRRHETSSSSSSLWTRLTAHHHTPLQFELQAFEISGSDSPVITLQGVMHTKYTQQTLISLYPHISQHAELMQRLVDQHLRFPTTFQFCFGSDGALQTYEVDVDEVHGLHTVLQSLSDVDFVLNSSSSVTTARVFNPQHFISKYVDDPNKQVQIRISESLSLKNEVGTGSPMDLSFILC